MQKKRRKKGEILKVVLNRGICLLGPGRTLPGRWEGKTSKME